MTVLVTGAGSGIGAALTDRLRDAGTEVVGWDIARQSNIRTVDVTDEAAVAAAAAELPEALTAVVVCAGISSRSSVLDTSPEEFRRVLDVNVLGVVHVAQAVHSRLSGGVFVGVGSVAGSIPMKRRAAYCASKAALGMFIKVLGSEWAPDRIQTLCVSPGFVDTGMAVRGVGSGGTSLSQLLARTPTGQLVQSDALVDILELAATGRLPGMTATEIVVDNGYASGTTL